MKQSESISVIGLGKLGLCTAACFASKGFKVVGVDVDIDKIAKINKGISPIAETGLTDLLKAAKHNLRATADYTDAILNTGVSFIVVATPSLADGAFSNEYLEKALHKIGEVLKKKDDYHLIVVTSTVMPGTCETVAKFILEKTSGKVCGKGFGLAYNPEFIALGSVIHDFLNPDLILIGEMNTKEGNTLENIYRRTCDNRPYFARMSLVNAEITKISLNCYVTTKITFANALAGICEKVKGADASVVTKALGMDSRIGSKYLRPGLGFGGPCFPRDNVAFSAFARRAGVRSKLTEIVDEVNRDQAGRVVEMVDRMLLPLTKDVLPSIAVLGLAYKPNTPIIEDSQALSITQLLVSRGYKVRVYDPQALETAKSVLGDTVEYAATASECIKGVSLAVIALPCKEFKEVNFAKINKNLLILDCWEFLTGSSGVNIRFLGKY